MGFQRLYAIGRQLEEFKSCPLPDPVGSDKGSEEYETADKAHFAVTFEDAPEQNPKNWPYWYKVQTILWVTSIGFSVAYASAVSPSAHAAQSEEFGISADVSALSTALFLFAFGIGAIPFAPLSEVFGRAPIYTLTLLVSGLFEIGAGASKTAAGILACRFFAGFFGSVVLALCGGSVNDVSDPIDRVMFFSIYAMIGVASPMFAPVVGGFVVQRAGWQWAYYHTGIFNCFIAVCVFLWCPETLSTALLRQKAAIYRKRSGDNRFHSAKDHVNLAASIKTAVLMPPKFLVFEPFVQFAALYLGVCFFVVFGYLESLNVVFGEIHHLGPEQIGLTFLPIAIGTLLGVFPMIFIKKRYERLLKERNGLPPVPEERMIPLLLAGPCLPISLFWIGWTSSEDINVFVPIVSGLFLGFAFVMVFIGIYMTAMDIYEAGVSNCLVVLTVSRYLISGLAVMVSAKMFRDMEPEWAATLLGIIGVIFFVITIGFYKYGHAIRARSRYAKGIDLLKKEDQEKVQHADQAVLERRKTDRSERSLSALAHPNTHTAPVTAVPPMSPVAEV